MSFGAFASIAGGLMGMSAANKQQKAQQAAIQAQMAGFNLAKPYISDMYRGGTDALNAALNARLLWWPNLCWCKPSTARRHQSMEGSGELVQLTLLISWILVVVLDRTTVTYTTKPLRICLATLSTMPATTLTHL